jgi:hypothetical protein
MIRFANLPVPFALAGFAPTFSAFETAFVGALCLDGEVHQLPALELVPPSTEEPPVVWQVPSLSDGAFDADEVPAATIATVRECMKNVDAATLRLGTSARETLRAKLAAMAEWVLEHHGESDGSIERFANAMLYRVRGKFLRRYGARRLWMELRDERQREAARYDDVAREAYLGWWYKRIGKLQRKHRWHVPGYAGEDVAGELLAQLITALNNGSDWAFLDGNTPGIEGTFNFLVRRKDSLKKRQQIHEVAPRDVSGSIGERPPTGEEVVLAREQRAEAAALLERTETRLLPRQRRYFDAVLEDALEHGYTSEVRIAAKLGVHKSTVSRAVTTVVKALRKSGAGNVLEGLKPKTQRAKRRLWRTETDIEVLKSPPRPGPVRTLPEHRRSESVNSPELLTRKRLSTPQPPWLDEGDLVRICETGEEGHVVRVDLCLVGPLYRVRCGDIEHSDLPREALEYCTACPVPF